MIKQYKYLKGYLEIEAVGAAIERFLNVSVKNKIYIWDIKRISPDKIIFCVSVDGFMIMRKTAAGMGLQIKILKREGIKAFLKGHKKRSLFLVSFLSVMAVIFVSSSFIWEIDIQRQDFIDNEKITKKLAEMNIKPGVIRGNLNYNDISDRLINAFDEILWANVELNGTKLSVTLIPRKIAPPIVPKNVPADIVAKKDGSILKIVTENGEAKVKAGDTALKGQLLIAGSIPSPVVGTRYLHSQGQITAITWTTKTIEKKLYTYNKIPTGNVIAKSYLELPFLKIPLQFFSERLDFYNYDSIIEENNIFFITFKKHIFSEYNLERAAITERQAVEEASLEFDDYIKNEGLDHVISKKLSTEKLDDETVKITMLIECEEELGVEKEIAVK